MTLSRMELDGTGSPAGLVTKILKAAPDLSVPIPIEDIARELDIREIRHLETSGFEGGLITDDCRSEGFILVRADGHPYRRRFTIGHELGHFLTPTHQPPKGTEFLCSREDLRRFGLNQQNARHRMEAEANQFAALLLIPPPLFSPKLARLGDPNIAQVTQLAKEFQVSKEAMARAYAEYHDEAVAMVIVKDGIIKSIYRSLSKFPYLSVQNGQPVPKPSLLHRAPKHLGAPTDLEEIGGEQWLQTEWGKKTPSLYEQVLYQSDGYALIMLWAEMPEDDEENDERTAKERYRDQQERWR
jgi:hypothetical protein